MNILLNFLMILNLVIYQQEKKLILNTTDFKLTYPSSLELDESGQNGTVFILKSFQEGENDNFVENINLVNTKLGRITFNEFKQNAKQEISAVANNVKSKNLNINGTDSYMLTFEFSQNNIDLKFIQYYLVKKQEVYVLTFSCEAAKYDNYFSSMNQVMMSFTLK